jgi:gamma-glutamylcyclotransferase (GGCT)/AIG2-like uncharacterized protein YtfP
MAEMTLDLIAAANSGDVNAAQELERTFGASERLAVYGSLAPGKANYHIVEPLGGEWTDGFIEGDLFQTGWGAALGYWAFLPRAGGKRIAVKVLTSPRLSGAWQMLDDFEGSEYERILVAVFRNGSAEPPELLTVANIYAANDNEVPQED